MKWWIQNVKCRALGVVARWMGERSRRAEIARTRANLAELNRWRESRNFNFEIGNLKQ